MDLRTKSAKPVSIADAAVESGLNTIVINGKPDRSLEEYMGAQETRVAPLLKWLRDHPTGPLVLNPDDDQLLSGYIALTYARSAQWRGSLAKRQAEAAQAVARELEDPVALGAKLEARGRRYTAADDRDRLRFLAELRQGRVPAGVFVNPWLLSVETVGGRATSAIRQMAKVVVHRPREPWLVCGDCAVILMRDYAFYGASELGIAVRDVRIVMPISDEAFVLATAAGPRDIAELLELWSTDDFAVFVNRGSFQHAKRFVFGKREADLRFARRAFETNRLGT